jgi:putative spermidine/putrescine transport system substrate-binding protein
VDLAPNYGPAERVENNKWCLSKLQIVMAGSGLLHVPAVGSCHHFGSVRHAGTLSFVPRIMVETAIDHLRQLSETIDQSPGNSSSNCRDDGQLQTNREDKMKKQGSSSRLGKLDLNRRVVLTGGAATILVPTYWKQASAQEKRIFIRDPGGPYADGFKEAFHDDFKKATGIESVGLQGQHEPTGIIIGMVDTKTYTWDMALLTTAAADQLVNTKDGYLEKLNVTSPHIASTPAEYKTDYFIGNNVFSTIFAYRTDAYEGKGREPPKTWIDVFDSKKFPGRRSIRKHPFDTIEQALLADGVALDKLYPLDFDRAFKKLDTVKKDIAVWWTGGAQTSQMLKSGEVDICTTWNGRAQAAIDDGAPVKIVWNQQLWSPEGWCILKGTPKADMCREFIKFAVDPARQAIWTKHVAYGPTHPDAYKTIDPKRAAFLPTHPDNLKNAAQVDFKFWAANKDKTTERFNSWVIS